MLIIAHSCINIHLQINEQSFRSVKLEHPSNLHFYFNYGEAPNLFQYANEMHNVFSRFKRRIDGISSSNNKKAACQFSRINTPHRWDPGTTTVL